MKTTDILTGTILATCRQELQAHLDLIELAIINKECDYSHEDWKQIAAGIDDKTREFNSRINH
jgi:hypothetical protein